MDVRELTFKGESAPQLYACGACGHCYSPKIYAAPESEGHTAARNAAEYCCKPKYCECGVQVEGPWLACPDCRERNMLARAAVIDAGTYNGPVSAACSGEWGEGYSSCIDAMIETCQDAGEAIPAYCHPCSAQHLRLDPDSLLEIAVDDMHEGAEDQIVDAKELVDFITAWNEKQYCVSYFEDRKRVIILDQERVTAILEGKSVEAR